MTNIIYATTVLGAMGAVFGLVLAFAAKVFAVEVDERQEAISGVLPGANCGGCGYAGCTAYAAAICAGSAEINKCAAGGDVVIAEIASIMGMEASASERVVALVRCSGVTGSVQKKFDYIGIDDCVAAMRLGGGSGPNVCVNGCLGLGTCVKACPFDAMHIVNGVAQVDREACVGCMACATACPKGIIDQMPYSATVTVPCKSEAKGAAVRKFCETGCIGCKKCEKACQHDAIHVKNFLASIDYTKCVNCGECVEQCPRNLIQDIRQNKTTANAS